MQEHLVISYFQCRILSTVRFLLNEPAFSIASPWVGVLLCSCSAAAWQKRSPYLPLHCRCARILLGSVVDSHCILHKLAYWWKRQSRANKSATHSARMRALIWGYEAFRTWFTWDKQPPSTFDFFISSQQNSNVCMAFSACVQLFIVYNKED